MRVRPKTRRIVNLAAVLLGAVVVLALLTTPAISKLGGNIGYAKHVQLESDIRMLRDALDYYKSRNGSYPTTAQGLAALMLPKVAKDPWNTEYVYRFPGWKFPNTYELFSAGPDHIADTADDDWGQ